MSFHRSSRRVQPTSLALETLEDRRVMATGITASLSGGVLNITGTVGNDLISLYQVKDQISVGGLTSVYAAKDVQSIVINGKSGDDFISLAGMGTIAKSVTILENGGNDTVRDAAGNDLFFSGGPHTVSVDAKGVKLDGAAPTWFDRNIHDAALRQLLKTDFADQTLDRKEMLGVFQQVEKAGVVSSVVLGDLKAVVNNASLFGSNNYVDVLASDVVLGNAANQFYAGASLGNLQAGDSAAKLDKLVGKWFLGADHPAATINGMTFQYTAAAGSLFGASGPQYSDVHQGYVGDCYFVATLGEIALRNPGAIRNMFIVNGDGTYTVRFFNNGKADFVTVDSQLPSYYGSFVFANMGQNIKSTSNVLWVALAEKAYWPCIRSTNTF